MKGIDNMSSFENEREYAWDDEISRDDEFIVLPEGDYDFEVTSFERNRSKGSDSIPPSNMAVLDIRVSNGRDSVVVKDYLVLHSKMEWKLSQFFRSIGQKKQGEKVRMNWNAVIGSKGRCKLIVDKYTNDKGQTKENNKIAKYYDYIAPAAPAMGGWKPGAF
jgi:hypothetical protein